MFAGRFGGNGGIQLRCQRSAPGRCHRGANRRPLGLAADGEDQGQQRQHRVHRAALKQGADGWSFAGDAGGGDPSVIAEAETHVDRAGINRHRHGTESRQVLLTPAKVMTEA